MSKAFKQFAGNMLLAALFLSACQAVPEPALEQPAIVPSSVPTVPPAPATSAPSTSPSVLWSFQTNGAIWGPPAIDDGMVYIGSDDGSLYALDAQAGHLKWKFTTQGLVRSRPAISAGRVYFASDDGFLYAVDAQAGQQVWRVDIGNSSDPEKRQNPGTVPDPTTFDYLQSSPVLSGAQVYVGSADGRVLALAADTGEITWSFKTGQKVRASPVIDEGTLYVGSWDGTVYALDAATGQSRWKTPIGGQVQSTAVVADDLVYTASRKASVVALDVQTGLKKWECDFRRNQWVESSPRLAGDIIYIGSSGNYYVRGLDALTGEVLTAYQGQVFFWSTPAVTEHALYIGAEAYTKTSQVGGLLSLELPQDLSFSNRSPMKLKWLLPIAETLMPDGNWAGVASSPVISGDALFFGGLDGKVYAVALDS